MKIRKEYQNKKWLLAVSGGADSMALLDLCRRAKMPIIVAHMNYQKRDSAKRDMEGVKAYCAKYDILCIVRMQEKPCVGNFQAFARVERYRFFNELITQYQLDGVLVAHHLDDHLETYIMQKERHATPLFYGIQEEIELFQCHVVRPLLVYTKEELEGYCLDHGVPYFVDESNLSDDYTRNKIRHHILAHMSSDEKKQVLFEIQEKNNEKEEIQKQVDTFLMHWDKDCKSLLKLSKHVYLQVMQTWLYRICGQYCSEKEWMTIHKSLFAKKHWSRSIIEGYTLYYAYDKLSLEHDTPPYAYIYDTLTYVKTPYFTCANKGRSVEAVTLSEKDFPITIRNVEKHDSIEMRFGTKKIHRWFIDRKIPLHERKSWPVVCNRDGKIILVPKIGCDISHFSNNPNLFVIK